MKNPFRNNSKRYALLVAASVLLVLAAACGEEPTKFQPVETTTSTTFDTTKTTRDATRADTPETPTTTRDATPDREPAGVEQEPTTTTTTGAGGSPDQETLVLPKHPPPTEDLLGPVPLLNLEDAVSTTETETFLTLTPDTGEQVIGWAATETAWNDNYEGTVDLVLDGWVVEHHETEADTSLVTVTMFFALEGNYVLTGRHPVLMSWLPEDTRGEIPPFRAVRYPTDSEQGQLLIPVDPAWTDPTIWVPLKPGEHREVSAQWKFPGNTDQFVVTATSHDDISYVIYPQDPGIIGNVADRYDHPRRITPSAGTLLPPCNGDCEQWGVPMATAYVWAWEKDDVGWDLLIHLDPYPDPSEMSNVDIRVWHERSNEVHFPTGDAWKGIDTNRGVASAFVEMPTLERPLYVQVALPSGRVLTWKTVSPLRDRLFSNPSWDWRDLGDWAQTQALWVADRICWAYWTGNRNPGDAASEPVYIGAEEPVDITSKMTEWVTLNVC